MCVCVCVAPGEGGGGLAKIYCMKEKCANQLRVATHSQKHLWGSAKHTHTHNKRHKNTHRRGRVTILLCWKISVLCMRVGIRLSGGGLVLSDRVTLVSDNDKAPWIPGPLVQYGCYDGDEIIRSDSGGSFSGICVCLVSWLTLQPLCPDAETQHM